LPQRVIEAQSTNSFKNRLDKKENGWERKGKRRQVKGYYQYGKDRKRGWATGEERGKGRARRDLAPTS